MKIEELYQIYSDHPSVTTDTRSVKAGDIFFALQGSSFNGNAFAAKAIEQGAAYAIIDDEKFSGRNTILVTDVLATLQQLANYHRKQFNIPFLAITGSNGKTTTKELVHAVLSSSYKTYTTTGNLNNHIGVPLTLLKMRKGAEMAVIEMGANHQKEIASYCQIAEPTHGLITNCGKAHLEGFGGEEGVRKGKGELFDYLRSTGGTAFIMQDYDYLQEMATGIKEIIRYGTGAADVTGHLIKSNPFLEVEMDTGMQDRISTNLVGSYNLPNVLAAVAVGRYFSVPMEKIKSSIEAYQPSNSRSQLMEKGSNKIILDAYNANPSSMKLAIENFAALTEAGNSNKILVLGAMAELGEESLKEHENLVREINRHQWGDVLLVGGDFQKLQHPFLQFATADDAGKWLREKNLQYRYFLIKGSRSVAMEKVLEYLS